MQGLLILAALAGQPAEPPGPRNGPEAAPRETPPFARPGPPPLVETPPASPIAPPDSRETPQTPTQIAILESDPARDRDAVPPPGWQPANEPMSGLNLDHRPREPLNAPWVRRQFALNAVADSGRAIALVQLINRAFLTAGFVNSGLLVEPREDANQLTLRLIHGRLTGTPDSIEVTFTDGQARGLDPDYLRERFPSATRQPLNAAAIERDFRLLTEDPALRTVDAQLRPGAAPGEASLLVSILPRERGDFYLTAGNSRSPTVGGERVAVGGYARHGIASGDLFSAEFGLTEGVIDAAAAYTVPILSPATSLNFRISYNDAAVIDAPLVPLYIRTRDVAGQFGFTHQLIRSPLTPAGEGRWSPSRTLSIGAAISHRRQESFLLGQPFSFAPGSVDGRAEYSALRLLGDLVLRNVDEVFAASVTGTIGLDGTRSNIAAIPTPDRHFLALLVQLNYARRLDDNGLELRARFTGQLASSILYSGERLGIGGEASVRGYRQTLLLADQGAVGSLELAYPFTLSGEAGRRRNFDWGAFSIAAFVDAAYAATLDGSTPDPEAIASGGVALTWQPAEGMSLRLSYGHAIVDAVPTGTRDLQDDGVHLRLTLYPLRLGRD
jgi:hemolysin activation/secretion protein